jgi:hypothetical protein
MTEQMKSDGRNQRGTWREGDIEIISEGEGEPILDKIIAANRREQQPTEKKRR